MLPYSLHQKHIPSFMGRMVVDPLDPNKRYFPDITEPGPQNIIPGIAEDPIPYKSRADIIQSAQATSLKVILASYFKLCGESSAENSVTFQSDIVKRYQMTQNELRLKKLMENADFSQGVTKLLEQYGKLYMVVGFLTTKATTWDMKAGKGRMATARAEIPLGEMTGLPNMPSVALGGTYQQTAHAGMTGEVEEEEIFAVAYDVLKKKRTLDWNSSMYVSSRPVLGAEKRVKGGFGALGDDDSEPEVDDVESEEDTPEDLVLEAWINEKEDKEDCLIL